MRQNYYAPRMVHSSMSTYKTGLDSVNYKYIYT